MYRKNKSGTRIKKEVKKMVKEARIGEVCGHEVLESSPVIGRSSKGVQHNGVTSWEAELDQPCDVSRILVLDIQLDSNRKAFHIFCGADTRDLWYYE
uniref:Uncharacterized protein n=1 Tax=Romanomermis culicivorax TaxID=13658 RepID=A0A915HUU2_ROMCU